MELVTGAMGSLLPKLDELLKEEYNLQKGVRAQIQSLTKELEIMHVALRNVAEVPREQLNPLVKLWAHDIRELSYDMEDIVDTFLVRVEDGREATPKTKGLQKLMKKMGDLFSKSKARHQIANAIEDVNKQLQEVTNRHGKYPPSVPAASTPIDPRLQALYREATELVGIDGKRDQELIKMLSEGDDVSKKKLKIVSVVGFGGLGKTTLVRAVYDKIKGDFNHQAFVPVGRNPDVKKVFKDILLDLDKKKYTKEVDLMVFDERKLIDEIREFLENKRYLIIIDDIWDEKLWGSIKLAFSNGNNLGSRLITTTRKVNVSEACCSSSDDIVYTMEPLSDDDSQRLFYQRIFSDRNGCPHELQEVSRDLLKKCGGVPLAIITIASLLASNKQIKTKDEWYSLLNSIGRGLTEHASVEEMQRILSFSYYDLPSYLKTCLLYLSIFPEDYEIQRDQLIWRWIAEGFVQPGQQGIRLFKVGESYFNELVNRSMIQPTNINRVGSARACRVHDMVLDLICALSGEENFVTILDGTKESMSQSKVRRLSLQNSKADEATPPVSVSQVRSITIFPPAINLMPPLSSFDVLRVLDLEGCYLKESHYLRHVGNLGHLRYLGLRNTQVGELPVEIGKLQLLQTLDLDGAYISDLPSSVVGLRHLMRLHIDNYTGVPNGLGALASLEELTVLWVGPSSRLDIAKELGHLTQLRMLKIEWDDGMCNRGSLESLSNLSKIQSLHVRGDVEPMRDGWVPSQCLRTFKVKFGFFSTLPTWIKPSLHQLSDLRLPMHKVRWEDIQILGMLPSLTHLILWATSGLIDMPVERFMVAADAFPRLRRFEFRHLVPVPFMFPQGAMPRLQFYLFYVRVSDIAVNGSLDADMGNLPSLERVDVRLFRKKANAAEVEEAKAALRHAADVHPNRPTIQIYVYQQ